MTRCFANSDFAKWLSAALRPPVADVISAEGDRGAAYAGLLMPNNIIPAATTATPSLPVPIRATIPLSCSPSFPGFRGNSERKARESIEVEQPSRVPPRSLNRINRQNPYLTSSWMHAGCVSIRDITDAVRIEPMPTRIRRQPGLDTARRPTTSRRRGRRCVT